MAEKYRDRVEFLLVYIREAHPGDGWQVPANRQEGILLSSAGTLEQKANHAALCVLKLDIKFPTVVDTLDNVVERAYSAWPDRLYLVGRDGRITWKGRPGPQGFRPDELEGAIKSELARRTAGHGEIWNPCLSHDHVFANVVG